MAETTKPLPDVEAPISAPFWAAAAKHELRLQVCDNCGHVRWPAASSCPECLSTAASWQQMSGRGTIWSLAIYEQVADPAFQDDLPYAIGAITLEEGPMLVSRVLGEPYGLEIGQAVEASFEDVSEGVTLVEFAVSEAEAEAAADAGAGAGAER